MEICSKQSVLCDFKGDLGNRFPNPPPLCETCGKHLRPDIVLFSELIKCWQEATIKACSCDVMIIVGTSLMVSPANQLPIYAKERGAILIEINPEHSSLTDLMDYSLRSTAVEALSILK